MEVTYALGAEMLAARRRRQGSRAARRDCWSAPIGTGRAAERFRQNHRGAGRKSGGRRRSGSSAASRRVRDFRRAAARFRRARRAEDDRSRNHRDGRRAHARRGRRRPVRRVRDHRAAGRLGGGGRAAWPRSSRATAPGSRAAGKRSRSAIVIADEADPALPLISHRVSALGVEAIRRPELLRRERHASCVCAASRRTFAFTTLP